MLVRAQQGDTVDALCWRHLRQTHGVVETVLEMNPGLADYGAVLPHGLQIELPEVTTETKTKTLIQLWD